MPAFRYLKNISVKNVDRESKKLMNTNNQIFLFDWSRILRFDAHTALIRKTKFEFSHSQKKAAPKVHLEEVRRSKT